MTEKKQKRTSRAIGIDLGTTFSCVSAFINGEMTVITNQEGERITPSVVAFEDGTRLVGTAAQYKMSLSSEKVVYDAKRFIGRGYDDPKIKDSISKWPFKVVRWDRERNCESHKEASKDVVDNIKIAVPKEDGSVYYYDPVEISSYVLGYLKECAQKVMNHEIDTVVITVPAHFNDNQREKTKFAGTVAGFKTIRLLNEPTAAAMAYGYGRSKADEASKGAETVLVFDLGGGTFDVSVLKFEAATEDGAIAEVLATEGDTFLGGVDFDNILIDYCLETWYKKGGSRNIGEKQKRRLRAACEKAKRNLSAGSMTTVELDCFVGEEDFNLNISRSVFENLCTALFKKCIDRVKGCLLSVGKGKPVYDNNGKLVSDTAKDNEVVNRMKNTIDKVILVGGSSRIPKVQELLKDFFDDAKLCHSIHPDEAIALGASYQAAMLAGDADLKAQDSILLLDTVPFNIAIETAGGIATPIITKNSTIPLSQTETFTTYSDNQPAVTIKIVEGERAMADDNKLLGSFTLTGIPPAPRGVPQIEVTCEVNNDGILTVTAKDKATSKQEKLSVTNTSGRLSKEEIQKMTEHNKQFEETDRIARERINARNQLDSQVYQVGKMVSESQVDQASKDNLLSSLKEIENWLLINPNATKEEIDKKALEVTNMMSKISGGGVPGQPRSEGQANDGPEVEEVD